jgi:uncharacterized DUF497 family protein
MQYQWDPRKATTNLRKHGIDFADSVAVFEDEYALLIADDFLEEDRYVAIGSDAIGRVLVVVFTERETRTIRIISARQATQRERREYEGSR